MAGTKRSYGTGSLIERDGAWHGKWRVDGRQVWRKLGPVRAARQPDGMTRTEAERALREAMGTLTADELDHLAREKGARGGRTIEKVAAAYLEARDLKPSTATDYRMHVRVHLGPFFDGQPVDRITPRDIDRLIRHLQGRQLAPKTVRTYLTTLSTLLRYAQRKRWITSNPMEAVDLPPMRDHAAVEPLRFLRVHEVNDLAASVVPGRHADVDRALYLTAALTGLRQGELRGLRWQDVNWTAQRLHVVRNIVRGEETSPKSRKARSVPMAPQVRDALAALRDVSLWTGADHPVFAEPLTGQPIARTPLMERYRRALTAAGIDPAFRFHDLRHTFGTSLAMAGVDVVTIQAYMGHAHLATTMRYMHYAPAGGEAERIGAAFAAGDPRGAVGSPLPNMPHLTPSQGIPGA